MRMRLLSLVFCLLCLHTARSQEDKLNSLEELRARKGLPNFFSRLKSGKEVKIVYLGGSITAAGDGWRDQTYKWFKQQYPGSNISQVNAGVGGTGSDLGVFRLQKDVLTFKPDLVFIEFAVNDGGNYIHQTMEGIVRKIWKADAGTDICFVYTMAGNMLPVLQQNKLMPSMLAMEHVAEHYGIPSIQMGIEALALIKEGKLIFQGKPEEYPGKMVFTGDNVHPNTHTGHRLYTEAVIRSMKRLAGSNKAFAHTPGAPYTKDNWEDAKMISVKDLQMKGNWQQLSSPQDSIARMFIQRFPVLMKSTDPAASIHIQFRGRLAGLYDIVGPGCGQYEVVVDAQPARLYPRFDRHAVYYRSHYFFLPVLDPGEHSIDLKVSDQKPDKMAILRQGTNQPGDLKRYEENAVYAGWLLLLGELN
jgi:hypothetical protein